MNSIVPLHTHTDTDLDALAAALAKLSDSLSIARYVDQDGQRGAFACDAPELVRAVNELTARGLHAFLFSGRFSGSWAVACTVTDSLSEQRAQEAFDAAGLATSGTRWYRGERILHTQLRAQQLSLVSMLVKYA